MLVLLMFPSFAHAACPASSADLGDVLERAEVAHGRG